MRVNLEYRTMVKIVKTASVGYSVFHSYSIVEHPGSRADALAGEAAGKTLAHLCNLVVDSHMVKVTSHLVCRGSEYSVQGSAWRNTTGGISSMSLSLNQGISSNS